MERLIEVIECSNGMQSLGLAKGVKLQDVYKKLYEYEERGVLLPCKVGTIVYEIYQEWGQGEYLEPEIIERPYEIYMVEDDELIFGKTVFLTKEEAEKVLAEREREQNV